MKLDLLVPQLLMKFDLLVLQLLMKLDLFVLHLLNETRPTCPSVANEIRPTCPAVANETRPTCPSVANETRPTCPSFANETRPTCPSVANETRPTCPSFANETRLTCPSVANEVFWRQRERDVQPWNKEKGLPWKFAHILYCLMKISGVFVCLSLLFCVCLDFVSQRWQSTLFQVFVREWISLRHKSSQKTLMIPDRAIQLNWYEAH